MSRSRYPLGLRSKLLLAMVAAGALPIAVALGVTYVKGEGQLRAVIGESFKALAEDNARKIAAELQRLQEDNRLLAREAAADPAVQAWLKNPAADRMPWPGRPDDNAATPALIASWIAAAANQEHGTAPSAGRIGPIEWNAPKDRHVFRTVTPLGHSGRLIREYDARLFFDPLVYPVRFGATGHVMLIDGHGTVISCPLLPTGSTISGWDLLTGTAADRPGWVQGHSDGHGGREMSLIGHAPVVLSGPELTDTAWYSFVWQDSGEIFAPVYSLRTGIATAVALAFGLLVVLGYYASRRIVAPIRKLGAGARRIAAGELDHAIEVDTRDEIEELAHQLDDMRMQLRKLIATLEDRVDQRTRALQDTEAEKQRIVEQLIQAEKISVIGTMASGIGHEINNPLYVILSAAETIRDSSDIAQCRDDAQAIVNRCKHIAAIVKNLSAYARPGDRQATESFDVNSKLHEALAMANRSLIGDNLTIVEKFGQVPPVRGKPEEIQQAFFNVIRNGIQAMHGNGTLTVESRYEKSEVVVKIRDTGTGIPKEHLNKIFDPFFTTKGPDEGEGLGLYVVRQTLTKNGGTIKVDSGHGAGTVFTMVFRAVTQARRTQDATQDPGH
ncbi:MAG: putative histidine kinase [Gammaproteobacteria bacterium]|nr:MAG: putative histidine kinase [Gammaproteobacteria bacterium]TND06642.1 MAG: putative histidine kinase [Gammaproteobacteria bacterium]